MTARDTRFRLGQMPLILATGLLFSCGGDPLPPQVFGSVTVTVTTTGEGPDADGYTVTLGSTERTVAASGSTTFGDLEAGNYDVVVGGVAANCSLVGDTLRSVTVSEGAEASVSFDIDCGFDAAGVALPVVTCSALSAATTEGMPLEFVSIGGVPSGFVEPIMARMSWSGGPEVTLGLVDATNADVTVRVPTHPGGSVHGGEVLVRISDETQSCPPFSFDILPLPAAPGELLALADIAQDLLDAQAVLFGTSRAELLDTPAAALERALLPLAIAQAMIDEDTNDQSLRAFVDGTASDFDAEDLDFVERLLARTGLRADLEAERDAIQSISPQARHSGPRSTPLRAPSPGLALGCVLDDLDAALLDECMTLARDKAQGAASAATQDAATFAMDIASNVSGIARPIASLLSFSQLYDEALANNLPSSFVSIEVTPAPSVFLEDQPGPGNWSPAEVMAISNGWNLEGLITDLITGRVTPDLRPTRRLTRIERFIARRSSPEFSTFTQAERFFQSQLENLIGALIGRGVELSDGLLTLPPIEYGPVDISDTEWSDARIVTGTSIELTPHETYEPREPGTSLLEVITAVGKFGGTSIASDHLPVTVSEIGVTISPAEVLLQPGEETTFTVTVTDALHPEDIELIDGQPVQGSASLTIGSGAIHTVTYTAPLEPTPNSTDLVAVHHVGEGGARAMSQEARSASATIRFGGITIAPVLECVSPGQQVQLQPILTGFDSEPNLVWSGPAESVDSNGLFTAPDDMNEVTITVAVEDQPDITASITIPVGGCTCSYSITVGSNPTYVGQPGDEASYFSVSELVPGEEFAIGLVTFTNTEGFSTTVGVEIPTTVVTGPGSYPVATIGGGLGYGDPEFFSDTNPPEGTLRIFDYEPHIRLTGDVIGATVEDGETGGPTYPFSATFQIYPPPGSLGWNYTCVVPEPEG